MKGRFVWRSRWAAFGAAVAVTLGAGGIHLTQAAPGPDEGTVVNVTPTRVLDTRDPTNLGLAGPFATQSSQKLQITGNVPVATGGSATVVPAGATGVLMNVTAVSPTANGFVSIRPGNATGAPTTSSLNVEAGVTLPNAVQVSLPTTGPNAGQIDITYDSYGVAGHSTELLIDIVGYTTSTGLQELSNDVPIVQSSTFNGSVGVTTSDAVVLSVTITPPSSGTVKAESALSGLVNNDAILCTLTTGSGYDGTFEQGGSDAGSEIVSLSGMRMFPATGGVPLTVNLVCHSSASAASVFDPVLTAEFFPNNAGSALTEPDSSPSLAEAALSD